MSYWKQSFDQPIASAFQSIIESNLNRKDLLPNFSCNIDSGHDKITGSVPKFFSNYLKEEYSLFFGRKILLQKLDINNAIMFCAERPWMFKDPGRGIFFSSIVTAVYSVCAKYEGEDERDINSLLLHDAVRNMNDFCKLVEYHDSFKERPDIFWAPTTASEGKIGADLALLFHRKLGVNDWYSVALLQGKKNLNINGTCSISRGDDGTSQLNRLISSGMSYYVFYQQPGQRNAGGISCIPATVKTANEVFLEYSKSLKLSTNSLSGDSLCSLCEFIFNQVFETDYSNMRTFSNPEDALACLQQQRDLKAMVALSAASSPAFEKLKILCANHALIDESKMISVPIISPPPPPPPPSHDDKPPGMGR
ncbi:hypothetical protein GLI01_34180 [Gluconacetobacter liquefaciens]|uniref:Uncharacterized protein n=1 Tax=Gluconacetobacter liquefaciens TaxID=89584 RepID=A0A370FX24_GLULI|nr:hypothetical protein [Gluconacetobacter liquefaciens]MBB2188085.1 hypothetical protein [Gluconacetobacter liquefaciens]RDI36197.1 hypothetical protein C7453_11278 [Gluconacetobacter liquefaciens]GEB39383.1 hypothetical protein GLI01_34180 [Gluconacetobacter liquefaciens]